MSESGCVKKREYPCRRGPPGRTRTIYFEGLREGALGQLVLLVRILAVERPAPLVTDDGEFVQIYRRRDHIGDPLADAPDHGVFVKTISFNALWPPDRSKAAEVWHDGR